MIFKFRKQARKDLWYICYRTRSPNPMAPEYPRSSAHLFGEDFSVCKQSILHLEIESFSHDALFKREDSM